MRCGQQPRRRGVGDGGGRGWRGYRRERRSSPCLQTVASCRGYQIPLHFLPLDVGSGVSVAAAYRAGGTSNVGGILIRR